jgi:general secretion pathway protein H
MKKADLRRGRGFSLIELLLVLSLLALLTAVTAPMITRGMTGARLKAATKKTAAMFRYARNESVSRKKPYWVVVDREENWIAAINKPLDTDEEDRYTEELINKAKGSRFFEYPEPVMTGSVTVGDEPVETQGAFVFYPNGSCSGGKIQVGIDDERFFTVSLDFITSMVSIQRGTEQDR